MFNGDPLNIGDLKAEGEGDDKTDGDRRRTGAGDLKAKGEGEGDDKTEGDRRRTGDGDGDRRRTGDGDRRLVAKLCFLALGCLALAFNGHVTIVTPDEPHNEHLLVRSFASFAVKACFLGLGCLASELNGHVTLVTPSEPHNEHAPAI